MSAKRFALLNVATNWGGPPRLARALTLAGGEVCVIAPPDSYLAKTRFRVADILMPPQELAAKLPAILNTLAGQFEPVAVWPGDDAAFQMLVRLDQAKDRTPLDEAGRALLAGSVPTPAYGSMIAQDSLFITQFPHGPIGPPPTIAAPTAEELRAFVDRHGLPIVLKRDGSNSGAGVSKYETMEEALEALKAARAAVAAKTLDGFVAQKFFDGAVYGCTLVGHRGQPLAGFSFKKHLTYPERMGATSVAHLDMREDLLAACRHIYALAGMTGFCGFDFVLDETGRPHLLEINPRIMPTSHLGAQFGADLIGALFAVLEGRAPPEPTAPIRTEIALFPMEWSRDPTSAYLHETYHDAPWDDPEVLRAMIESGPQVR